MSFIKRMIQQSSIYMIGEIIIMAGGFISFPIFTRVLSKEEYGLLNLISIALLFVEAISSVGLRHASQRFYSNYKKNNEIEIFYSTTIYSSFTFGLFGTLIVFLSSDVLSRFNIISSDTKSIIYIASILVFIRVFTKIIGCLYRVREKAVTYCIFAILPKYLGMALSILFTLTIILGVKGFYVGMAVGELLILIILIIYMKNEMKIKFNNFSFDKLNEMLKYGIPLVIAGFASIILASGDRYIIGYFYNASDVATYSVPYNLCQYLKGIIVTSFEFAFIPLIMNKWCQVDDVHISSDIEKVIRLYFLLTLPIIFGASALGEQFITLLASYKYENTGSLMSIIITGEMIGGLMTPLMIGLQFHNKTKILMILTWVAAGLNLILNCMMVPIFGLYGAAFATLICYCFIIFAGMKKSKDYFYVSIPYKHLSLYTISSFLMFLLIKIIECYFIDLNLIFFIIIGLFFYCIMLITIDYEIRDYVNIYINKIVFNK